jgi:hypothetical protein
MWDLRRRRNDRSGICGVAVTIEVGFAASERRKPYIDMVSRTRNPTSIIVVLRANGLHAPSRSHP